MSFRTQDLENHVHDLRGAGHGILGPPEGTFVSSKSSDLATRFFQQEVSSRHIPGVPSPYVHPQLSGSGERQSRLMTPQHSHPGKPMSFHQ